MHQEFCQTVTRPEIRLVFISRVLVSEGRLLGLIIQALGGGDSVLDL